MASEATLEVFVCFRVGNFQNGGTVFAQSDAAASIYFIVQVCAASIQERHLLISVNLSLIPDHSHIFNVHGGSGLRMSLAR